MTNLYPSLLFCIEWVSQSLTTLQPFLLLLFLPFDLPSQIHLKQTQIVELQFIYVPNNKKAHIMEG